MGTFGPSSRRRLGDKELSGAIERRKGLRMRMGDRLCRWICCMTLLSETEKIFMTHVQNNINTFTDSDMKRSTGGIG